MDRITTTNYSLYDSWDLKGPKVPPHSRLYHLSPVGIGTAHTESCRSYIARLAKAHCISIRSLFEHELVPASGKSHLMRPTSTFISGGHYSHKMKSINGRGPGVAQWVAVLEKLTLRRNLRFLTMLTWRNVITAISLQRPVRAWCPQCFEKQRKSGESVCEQLLWTLKAVNVCVPHQRRLETACPQCGRPPSSFDDEFFSGYCTRCRAWLGSPDTADVNHEGNAFNYQLWVAREMGELVKAAPAQESDPSKERLIRIVPALIKQTAGGSAATFADLVGIRRITIYLWLERKYTPTTDQMLKICYRIGLSFSDILTKTDILADADFRRNLERVRQRATTMPPHRQVTLETQLLSALQEDPPPSLRDVANRLGYKHTSQLRARCPVLAKRLTSKYRTAFPLRRKIRDQAVVKSALKKALKANPPPSLDQIARDLGYAEARSLQQHRDLYDEIIRRRQCWWAKRQNDLRVKLEAVLLQDPPPSMKQLPKTLGYKSAAGIKAAFPELATAIIKRHALYRRAQIQNIRSQLRAILAEQPPICLRATGSHLGRSCDYLRNNFPKECEAIVRNYSDSNHKAVKERKAHARTRVRQLAMDLCARGIYPSHSEIRSLSRGPIGLDCLEVSAALCGIRHKFSILKRRRRRLVSKGL
jgi:hypothetical protein